MTVKNQNLETEHNIHYKGIVFERIEDAPFMGALIIANNCLRGCKGCFNQHLKTVEPIIETAKTIIQKVKKDSFNKGVILGGLEWTYQPKEAQLLITEALKNNLQVILYTYMREEDFKNKFKELYDNPIYFKFGEYIEGQQPHMDKGVQLASNNQHIVDRRNIKGE